PAGENLRPFERAPDRARSPLRRSGGRTAFPKIGRGTQRSDAYRGHRTHGDFPRRILQTSDAYRGDRTHRDLFGLLAAGASRQRPFRTRRRRTRREIARTARSSSCAVFFGSLAWNRPTGEDLASAAKAHDHERSQTSPSQPLLAAPPDEPLPAVPGRGSARPAERR